MFGPLAMQTYLQFVFNNTVRNVYFVVQDFEAPRPNV